MDIKSTLYQELILEHSRKPRNFGLIDPFTQEQVGNNPLCGDKLILFTHIKEEKLDNISFKGEGCAIFTSSTSMMTELVKNKSVQEVHDLINAFEKMILQVEPLTEIEKSILSKLIIFQGVKQYPARVKCALLGFRTLEAIIDGQEKTVSTE